MEQMIGFFLRALQILTHLLRYNNSISWSYFYLQLRDEKNEHREAEPLTQGRTAEKGQG